jgi:tetratricopeptide (TPR) repeat protein
MMPLQRSLRMFLFAAVAVTLPAFAQTAPRKTPPKQVPPTTKSAPPARAEAAPKDDPAKQHFDSAQTYQLAGDFDNAAKEYRQAVAIALDHLGNLRASRQDYPGAQELLKQAIATNPDDPSAVLDLAITELYTGDTAKPEAEAKAVLQKNPDNFRAHVLLGKIAFLRGDYQAAADELHAALELTTDFDVAYSLALADLQLKKTALAIVLFDEMKNSLPQSAQMHVLIGRAFLSTGYPQLATKEFEQASTLDPQYPFVHLSLGMASVLTAQAPDVSRAESQSELAKAETALQEAIRLEPKDARGFFYLGQCYRSEEKWEKAVAAYRALIKLTPSARQMDAAMAGAYEGLAEALGKLGKPEEARIESAKAQQIHAAHPSDSASDAKTNADPDAQDLRAMMLRPHTSEVDPAAEASFTKAMSLLLGQAYHNLGVIDARDSRYAGAAEEFSQAAKWDSTIPSLDRNWGLAAFRAERYDQAVPPLERQLRRTPDDLSIREMLGLCYYMGDRFKESAATLRPVLDQLPDNPGLLYAAGVSLVRSNDAKAAEGVFSRMLQTGQSQAPVHLMLGQAYAQEKNYPEALAEFARALELDPQTAEAHYGSGMVSLRQGNLDASAEQFQQELTVNPGYIPAEYQLGYVRLQLHQAETAIPLLQDVVKRQPDHSDAHFELGKAWLEQGKLKDAIQDLETSVRLQPTDYAYYQLSLAYRREGRVSDADQAMLKYQQLKPKPQLDKQQ